MRHAWFPLKRFLSLSRFICMNRFQTTLNFKVCSWNFHIFSKCLFLVWTGAQLPDAHVPLITLCLISSRGQHSSGNGSNGGKKVASRSHGNSCPIKCWEWEKGHFITEAEPAPQISPATVLHQLAVFILALHCVVRVVNSYLRFSLNMTCVSTAKHIIALPHLWNNTFNLLPNLCTPSPQLLN